jgi:hypothetical protein
MTTITKVRQEDARFDIHINDDMPEMFTDGISRILMGNTISKLTFHSVTNSPHENSNEIEVRKGVLLLTIPTPVLLEMCRNILTSAQSSIDAFSDAGKKTDAQVRKIMDGVNFEKLTALKEGGFNSEM